MNTQIKKKAFTMIELMIVVAIISVLSIVLIPKAKSQYEQSKMIGVVKNKDLLETIVRSEYEKPTFQTETEDSSIDRVYQNLENNEDLEEMTNPFSKSGKGIGFIKGNTIEDTHKAGYILTEEPEIETLPKGTVYTVIKDKEVTSGIVNPDELVPTGNENNTPQISLDSIKIGYNAFSTILLENNNVYVFGRNDSGVLGLGDKIDKLVPELFTLTTTIQPKSMIIGISHSLAIGTDNNLYAWGRRTEGQLGIDGENDMIDRTLPILVELPDGVKPKLLQAGRLYSMMIGTDGNLYSWGKNNYGQLGIEVRLDKTTPTRVIFPNEVKPISISTGSSHTLSIGDDGNLYTWGENTYGQLGVGTTTNSITSPKAINLPNEVKPKSIASGDSHSLAIGDDGNLYSWGYNYNGTLGDGTTTNKLTPTLITLPNGIKPKSIYTGMYATYAIGDDGNLYSWGQNTSGQLGIGTTSNKTIPTLITLPEGVKPKSIQVGYQHISMIGTDGNMYTWGDNTYGQLGTGDKINRTTPTLVKPFDLIK